MSRTPRCLPALLAAVLLPATAGAQANAQDLSTTRSLALGDAFRAVATSNEALYFNLAGMAMAPRYEVDLAYARSTARDGDLYNVSIVDGLSTSTATGLAYSRMVADGRNGHVVNLGFAWGLAGRASLGLGLKYLNFSDPEETNAVTGDVGLLLRPVDLLSVGIAAYNVIDVHSVDAPLRAAVGASLGTDTSWRLAADVVFDFAGDDAVASYHAGAEYLLAGAIPLRAGFKHLETTGANYLSAGLGFVGPSVGLEAAFVQNLGDGASGDRTFALTLKFFL